MPDQYLTPPSSSSPVHRGDEFRFSLAGHVQQRAKK
jgi:hypothetical protein